MSPQAMLPTVHALLTTRTTAEGGGAMALVDCRRHVDWKRERATALALRAVAEHINSSPARAAAEVVGAGIVPLLIEEALSLDLATPRKVGRMLHELEERAEALRQNLAAAAPSLKLTPTSEEPSAEARGRTACSLPPFRADSSQCLQCLPRGVHGRGSC